MNAHELAAYRAGLRHAADMALVTAMTLELRSDASKLRQQAAIEALRGLAVEFQDAHIFLNCPVCLAGGRCDSYCAIQHPRIQYSGRSADFRPRGPREA